MLGKLPKDSPDSFRQGRPDLAPPLSDVRQSLSLYLGETRRRLVARASARGLGRLRIASRIPERLIVAPTDLRAADPYIADEIYAGRFSLAGRVLETGGASPFSAAAPSEDFARQLHAFRWLRHLRAANHELAFANARALTDDWIQSIGRRISGVAWDPDVVAQRVIAWLSHSPVVLKGADHASYRRFLRSLAVQLGYLRRVAATAADGEPRFRVRIALAMATLALPSSQGAIRTAARALDAEIDRQILPDGGHVSRNPQAGLDLLADLLPLRQTYVNLVHGSPGRLIPAIDRMFPALRFFRHGDGELALFNGATAAPAERLLSVLRYDETSGAPFRHLPHTKFQRLSAGTTTIIADTGAPPQGALSTRAHAGCLSFEMSSGGHRIIVNAGAPLFARDDHAHLARSTAAHSTVTVENTSSSRTSPSRFLGPVLAGGVRAVAVSMADGEDGSRSFTASHDGYVPLFGLVHERLIRLSGDGGRVEGRDRFHRPGGEAPRTDAKWSAVARFHIHPKTLIARGGDNELFLTTPQGELWTFHCGEVVPEIQDDVFFADIAGPRRSRQIALAFRVGPTPEIRWTLVRR